MQAPVIDTLGLADRLESEGLESGNAQAIAQALGDELAERMVTKRDLAKTEAYVRTGFENVDAKLDAFRAEINGELSTIRAEFKGDSTAIRADLNARFEAADSTITGGTTAVRGEMASEFKAVRSEMAGEFKAVRSEMAGEFKAMRAEMAGGFNAVAARFESVDARFNSVDAKFESVDARFESVDTKFESVDTKFESVEAKLQALDDKISTQGRFVFLILAVVVGLGIFSAAAPYMLLGELRQTLAVLQATAKQPLANVPATIPAAASAQNAGGQPAAPTPQPLGDTP